jgi:hypothetical protein
MLKEMDQGQAIAAIVVGTAAIVVSFFIKPFYAAKANGSVSDKKIPTWMGRLIFCTVGGMMILVGLIFFFPNH